MTFRAAREQVVQVIRSALRTSELVVDVGGPGCTDVPYSDLAPGMGPDHHRGPGVLELFQESAVALGHPGLDGGPFHLSTPNTSRWWAAIVWSPCKLVTRCTVSLVKIDPHPHHNCHDPSGRRFMLMQSCV